MTMSCTQVIPQAAGTRTAILASPDISFRQRVRETLAGLRWQVREAGGGAEALAQLDAAPAEALILDSWLPDLEIQEFVREFEQRHPGVDLITIEGDAEGQARSPRRNELLYALRRGQDADGAIWNSAPRLEEPESARPRRVMPISPRANSAPSSSQVSGRQEITTALTSTEIREGPVVTESGPLSAIRLPEFIGNDPIMLEVSRRIRLVAPRRTPVLIQGPTGTGKELVAHALHRLSARVGEPFVALNCAAIPEALLEAELFGHTRGAFTGAVQGRTGRIEAAQGGTLFLDEIGEMPVALQAKLLRFVECGELQRIGDNVTVRVDVRIVAATHRPLAELCREGRFRPDLYYRLAVFLIKTPPLASHVTDVPLLAGHFLLQMGQLQPVKRLSVSAMEKLSSHCWPGNVRELEHVLERASILAEERPEIESNDIEFGDQPCVL
jgi:DNA-binding NtrC family response regulator